MQWTAKCCLGTCDAGQALCSAPCKSTLDPALLHACSRSKVTQAVLGVQALRELCKVLPAVMLLLSLPRRGAGLHHRLLGSTTVMAFVPARLSPASYTSWKLTS